jgi:hypothetical protein
LVQSGYFRPEKDRLTGSPAPSALDLRCLLLGTAGLRQSDVARRAQISQYSLSHIVAGRRNVGGAIAARIAAVYGDTSIMDLSIWFGLLPLADTVGIGA